MADVRKTVVRKTAGKKKATGIRKAAARKKATGIRKAAKKKSAGRKTIKLYYPGLPPGRPPLQVLRTDSYFSNGRGLSVAFIRTGTNDSIAINKLEGWHERLEVTSNVDWQKNALEQFIYGLSVIRPETQRFPEWPRDFIDGVLLERVVIERSPVSTISLHGILSQSPYIAVGTYVGMTVAADHPYLMLVTVPGGIVVIGAAIGVSRGLMNGLAQGIERIVKERLS